MKDLDNLLRSEDLLQVVLHSVVEGIHLQHIEEVAVILETQLDEGNWFSFDETLTVKPKNRRWLTSQDCLAQDFDVLLLLYHGVVLSTLGSGDLGGVELLLWREWCVRLLLHEWGLLDHTWRVDSGLSPDAWLVNGLLGHAWLAN